MALVSAPGQNREKKVFCHDLPPAGGLWWAGPRVEGYEMSGGRAEDSGLSGQDGFGLAGEAKTSKNGSFSQVKLAAMT